MDEKTCESCSYFKQHYVKMGNKYHKIALGHCIYPRVKSRDKDTKACERYAPHKNEPPLAV